MEFTLVEKMLPARVLLSIGNYIQSAAQLELAVWQVIMLADKRQDTTDEWFFEFLEVKKITLKLINKFRVCACEFPPPIAIRVINLADRILVGLENRNLVAHGVFFQDDRTGAIKASHYFPRGVKKDRKWFEVPDVFSQRVINQALNDIDTLLREAVDIRSQIENSARP